MRNDTMRWMLPFDNGVYYWNLSSNFLSVSAFPLEIKIVMFWVLTFRFLFFWILRRISSSWVSCSCLKRDMVRRRCLTIVWCHIEVQLKFRTTKVILDVNLFWWWWWWMNEPCEHINCETFSMHHSLDVDGFVLLSPCSITSYRIKTIIGFIRNDDWIEVYHHRRIKVIHKTINEREKTCF